MSLTLRARASETRQSRLNEILSSRDKGTYILPTKITFGELLEQWLDGYVAANCGLSTQDSYRSQIKNRITPTLGVIPLSRLTPRHLQSFSERVISGGRSDGKGLLTRRTPQLLLQIIHGALEYALRMDLIIKNVANAVVLPPAERGTFTTLAVKDIPPISQVCQGDRLLPSLRHRVTHGDAPWRDAGATLV